MRRSAGTALLALVLAGVAPTAEEVDPVATRIERLRAHLQAHPAAGAADAYKLLHQSVFGPAHLISDRAAAASYLEREWSSMGPTLPGEPLVEPLADDPPLVRVNLRPFRDRGGDRERLLDAMVATANQVRGEAATFAACLAAAVPLVGELRGETAAAELGELARAAAGQGYPAAHHSPAYQEAHRPAYRVVLAPLLAPNQR